jgi:hypothetical protein
MGDENWESMTAVEKADHGGPALSCLPGGSCAAFVGHFGGISEAVETAAASLRYLISPQHEYLRHGVP